MNDLARNSPAQATGESNWTSLNTRILRSVVIAGLALVLAASLSTWLMYERYLERELSARAKTLVHHAEDVTGFVEFREDLEWHLLSLKERSVELSGMTIVEQTSNQILASTTTPISDGPPLGAYSKSGSTYTFSLPFRPGLNSVIDADEDAVVAHVALHADELKRQIWQDLLLLITILVGGVAAIGGLIYSMIRRRVLAPLQDINLALHDRDLTMLEQTSSSQDEIGDVAEVLKKPLRQLQESLNKLQSVLDHVADGIVALDEYGHVQSMNGAAEQALGISQQAASGLPLTQFLVNADNDSLEFGEIVNQRCECFATRDESLGPAVELAVSSFSNGASTLYTAVIRDISDWKEHQQLLLEAVQKAEDAVRTKSQFLATMSHEIRTPMNGVLGMSQLLLDMDLKDDQRNTAELIYTSAESLLTLINDILDFSKVEAGKLDFEATHFDLKESIEEVVELLSGQAEARSLAIHLQMSSEASLILHGDIGRIRQVIVNLLSNAIKFSENSDVTLAVERMDVATNGEVLLKVSIRDQGIGISPAAQAQLFSPFTQADASMSRRYGGTGLGLAICKQLVELMGGEIGVESVEGSGSTFWFTLRLPVGDRGEVTASGFTQPDDISVQAGLRVLLAEDNIVNQKVATRMLAKLSCTVDVAANGREAYNMWEEFPYDLVLMDCQMPELDGMAATREIRHTEQQQKRSRTPIIALTANAMESDRQACLEAGMDAHVAKPLRYPVLVHTLSQWCVNSGTQWL